MASDGRDIFRWSSNPAQCGMFWEFADTQQLMEALASGIVPQEIVHAETVYSRADDGRLWIWLRAPLPRTAGRKLRELGVRAKKRMPVSHWWFTPGWWGAVPLGRLAEDEEIDPGQPVILQVPLGGECARTLWEIERLGGKIEGFQPREEEYGSAFVKVSELPFFSQLVAREHNASQRQKLYLEYLPHVWVEAGFTHPLIDQIPSPEDGLFLLAGSGRVATLKRNGFRKIREHHALPVSRTIAAGFHSKAEETISIPLRLAAQPTLDAARFWIVSQAELHRWTLSAGQMLLEQLAVALWPLSDPPLILVRPLSDKHPPVLVWDALAFHPSRIVPEVHLPMGYELHPSARPDVLRFLLDCQGETLTWLTRGEPGEFGVHAVSLSAFGPLREWVDYELGQSVLSWQSWSPRLSWETEAFEILEETEPRQPKPKRRFKVVESEDKHIRKDPNPKTRSSGQKKPRTPALPKPSNRPLVDLQEQSARKRLAELEETLLASDLPLDADEHQPRLARHGRTAFFARRRSGRHVVPLACPLERDEA